MNTKNITVLQVLPALESGGVEKGTLEVAKFLVEKGHRSIVISKGGRLLEQLIKNGSEHIKLDIGKKSLLTIKYIPFLIKFIKISNIDVIHVRSRFPAWIIFLTLKFIPKKTRPLLVTTVHGPYSINFYSSIMAKGDLVIAISEMIKKYVLDNYKVHKKRLYLNYRGVDSINYNNKQTVSKLWSKDWFREYPKTKNKILVTLPARITRWKGQEDFISLILQLKDDFPDIHGLIVGDAQKGKKKFLKSLRAKVKLNNLSDDITFTGHRVDIKEIMLISKIVFSLSNEPEAFGRVSLEALSLGIPVIAYSHGGVEEQLKKILPSGLVAKNSNQLLYEKTKKFLIKPPIPKKNNHFLLKNMLENTLNIYFIGIKINNRDRY